MASDKQKRRSGSLFSPGYPGESTGKAGRTEATLCYAGIDAASGVPFVATAIDTEDLRLVRLRIHRRST